MSTPIDIKVISDDLISYLEMARIAMDHLDIFLREEMDITRSELTRLKTNLDAVMSTTSVHNRLTILTDTELQEAGRNMWYRVTDDNCQLRGGGPDMFANHLLDAFFPDDVQPS